MVSVSSIQKHATGYDVRTRQTGNCEDSARNLKSSVSSGYYYYYYYYYILLSSQVLSRVVQWTFTDFEQTLLNLSLWSKEMKRSRILQCLHLFLPPLTLSHPSRISSWSTRQWVYLLHRYYRCYLKIHYRVRRIRNNICVLSTIVNIGHLHVVCVVDWKLNRPKSTVNPVKTKRRLLYLKTQFVPRSKHFSSRL
jgi:hypothetical protein